MMNSRDVDTSCALLCAIAVVYLCFNFWAHERLGADSGHYYASSHMIPGLVPISDSELSKDQYQQQGKQYDKGQNKPAAVEENIISVSPPKHHHDNLPSSDDGGVSSSSSSTITTKFHPSKWKPRLMAMVPISWPPKHNPRVEEQYHAILKTWGSHVEVLRFVVSANALAEHPASDLPWLPERMRTGELIMGVPMTRDDDPKSRNIWEKMWRAWKLAGEEYLDKFDYIAKVDFDSFFIAENMRVFGSYLDPDQPWYVGHTLFHRWRQNLIYNSGTCYVLSREAVRRLSIRLQNIPKVCYKCGGTQCADRAGAGEDPQTGGCLRDLNIVPTDSLDRNGRQRFLPFRPRDHLFNIEYKSDPHDWFWHYKGAIGQKQVKQNCCSNYPIAFHNFKTDPAVIYNKNALYELEYFFHSAPYESRILGMDPPSGKSYQYDPMILDFELEANGDIKNVRDDEKRGKWLTKENVKLLQLEDK